MDLQTISNVFSRLKKDAQKVIGKNEGPELCRSIETFFIHSSRDIDKRELLHFLMMQILKCLLKSFYDANKSVA